MRADVRIPLCSHGADSYQFIIPRDSEIVSIRVVEETATDIELSVDIGVMMALSARRIAGYRTYVHRDNYYSTIPMHGAIARAGEGVVIRISTVGPGGMVHLTIDTKPLEPKRGDPWQVSR